MKFRFEIKYFLIFSLILLSEILIAVYAKDETLRGFVGDVLVVILIYSLILSFFEVNKKKTLIWIALFAILVEISQAFHLVEKLGLGSNKFFSILLGNHFDANDILAYISGCIIIYLLEFYEDGSKPRKKKFLGF